MCLQKAYGHLLIGTFPACCFAFLTSFLKSFFVAIFSFPINNIIKFHVFQSHLRLLFHLRYQSVQPVCSFIYHILLPAVLQISKQCVDRFISPTGSPGIKIQKGQSVFIIDLRHFFTMIMYAVLHVSFSENIIIQDRHNIEIGQLIKLPIPTGKLPAVDHCLIKPVVLWHIHILSQMGLQIINIHA